MKSIILFVIASMFTMFVHADEVHLNAGARYEVGDGNERNEAHGALDVEYLFGGKNQFGVLAGAIADSNSEPYAAFTYGVKDGALRSYAGFGYAVIYTNAGFQTFESRVLSPTETVLVASTVLMPKKDSGYIGLFGTELSVTDTLAIGGRVTYGKTDKYKISRSTLAMYLSMRF